jgi:hypothetical protein
VLPVVLVLVLVLVLENPDRFAIRQTEQISSIGLFASRNPNASRTSTTTRTRTIPNFGIWEEHPTGRVSSPQWAQRLL